MPDRFKWLLGCVVAAVLSYFLVGLLADSVGMIPNRRVIAQEAAATIFLVIVGWKFWTAGWLD